MDSGSEDQSGLRLVVDHVARAQPPSAACSYVNSVARDWPRYRDEFKRASTARLRAHKWSNKYIDRVNEFGKRAFLRQADGSEKFVAIVGDELAYEFSCKANDADRAEEVAGSIVMLLLDDTIKALREAVAPSVAPFDFAVGDDVAISHGGKAAVSVVAYAGANAFRHVKEWEAFLTSDNEFDPVLTKQNAKRNIETLELVYGLNYPVTERPCSQALRALAGTTFESYGWRDGADRDSWLLGQHPYSMDSCCSTLLERILSVARDACLRYGCSKNEFSSSMEASMRRHKAFAVAVEQGRRLGFFKWRD